MESYPSDGVTPLWDLSQASTFSQLPDDDFLALLQKQFPNSVEGGGGGFSPVSFDAGVDPQAINPQPFTLSGLSPPSDDSPSPPSINNDSSSESRPQSRRPRADTNDGEDSALKRKASDDDLEEGPSQKSQHTDKKSISNRRKSTGNDESRLLKRKEQNRAAQRAFRERKEKHVKDLEDQVAALEAKNQETQTENENLRDLLARLQDENVALKQSAFTFSVPKPSTSNQPVASGSNMNIFNSNTVSPTPSHSLSPPASNSVSSPTFDGMDWTSLTTFDPAMLQLLDESPPQTTATEHAMNMDFGFGSPSDGNSHKSPYTTIAANPMFMSFADYDTPESSSASTSNDTNSFDWNAWTQSPSIPGKEPSLEDFFGGSGTYQSQQGLVDLNVLVMGGPSPIAHRASPGSASTSSSSASNPLNSSSQSPASSAATSPSADEQHHNNDKCPKTKEEAAKRFAEEGASVFVQPSGDGVLGKMVACRGSSLPSTEPKPDDVEVLTAWRGVTSDPHFKDNDLNELCAEFSSKAKCDGSRVVVEGATYQQLLAKLANKQRPQ